MSLLQRCSLAFGLALTTILQGAFAQAYPNRPVVIIQGFAPGGNADAIARILGQEMSKGLGQPILVEAKAGAAGIIANDFVAKSRPDGHTLLLVTGGHSVAGALHASLPYDTVKSFDMISTVSQVQFVIVVRSDSKLQTLPALIAAAKAAPGGISFGCAGIGTTQHLSGELLGYMAGVKFLAVPYKGDAPAISGLLGGDTQFVVAPATTVLGQLKAGKVRALAVTGKMRWANLPDVPTVEESGVAGYDVRPFLGLAVASGTPPAIVERLNAEVQRALKVPEVRTKLEDIGGDVTGSTPEEMRALVAADLQRWVNFVKAAEIPRQ